MTNNKITNLLKKHYNLKVTKTKELAGYIDKNYLIETEGGAKSRTNYLLKCSTSDPLFYLQAQNQVLSWLNEEDGFKPNLFPELITANNGEEIIEDSPFNIRLLSFLEGSFLAEVVNPSDVLYRDIGHTLGQLNIKMQQYEWPALSHVDLDWDMKNTLGCLALLDYVDNIERKRVVHYFLLQFKENVHPVLSILRKSILHNDPNPMNILVDGDKVTGLIDFGDMVYSCIVFEPAIALAYLMMDQEKPLEVATHFLKAYHKVNPLDKKEVGLLYELVAARLCRTIAMAAKNRANNPTNAYASSDEDSAWALLKKWLTINPIKVENTLREACGWSAQPIVDSGVLVAERHLAISKSQSISYDRPITMTKGALQYMYDNMGNSYVDCVNNIMHVGHCHPKVVTAAQKQMALLNTNTRYLYPSLHTYAQKLLSTLPHVIDKIFFVNSGSAATDLAIRMAKVYTSHEDVIVIDQGYHGNTQTGIDVSAYKFDGKGGPGVKPHVHVLRLPDVYRDPRSGVGYSQEVDAIVESYKVAAFIGESILSCGGQLMLPEGYLEAIYEKVRAAGALCIADEVQVGFGRVGAAFWGFELQGVQPDIVILGKPIGNGHPMAAVATTSAIAEAFDNGMEFFSSFGGNPVSCVIGAAVLDVIEEEQLQAHAKDIGDYLLVQWRDLLFRYSFIGDVRGVGLFLGIEIVIDQSTKSPDAERATYIVNQMKARGFLLSTDGPHHNVIKFKPPMVFSIDNAKALCKALEEVLMAIS